MNVGCFKKNPIFLGQALPAEPKAKNTFFGIRARRKRRRISSCLAEELEADIQSVVPEFKTPPTKN